MKRSTLCLLACVLCLCAAGCASLRKDKAAESPYLEPQATLKFNDVPVPAGFVLMPQDSYSFEASGVRVAMLKYRGKASPDQVVNFYKEQMPMYNWAFLNAVEYGQRILSFEREQETCLVTLLSKGNNNTLTIALGPKSQMPKKASSKPVK